jgi:hypothetical protein
MREMICPYCRYHLHDHIHKNIDKHWGCVNLVIEIPELWPSWISLNIWILIFLEYFDIFKEMVIYNINERVEPEIDAGRQILSTYKYLMGRDIR